ncbi:Uncharacterized protein APZ42_012584 [Daphnia magna]|uniref:Uncharacterized protein n=1 Tax=Daphnia magna TaxID=35525 RepID=A0A162RN22_9CRUS|nr:Uncharacterized protein APZ42_012584 [Daphnia magna]
MREFLIKSRNLTEPDLITQNRAYSTERQTIQLTKRFLAETIKAPAVNHVSPGSPQVEPVNVPPVEQINLPPAEITTPTQHPYREIRKESHSSVITEQEAKAGRKQVAILDDIFREVLEDARPPETITYDRLVECNKSKLNRSGLSSHTQTNSYKLQFNNSCTGAKRYLDLRVERKCFMNQEKDSPVRPDPEKHFGYRIILLKAGKQCQTEEKTNEAKDPVASKEALMRVAQAEALKAMSEHPLHQKAVFNFFQTLLGSDVMSYTLWKELENTIPKGVFRRLRLPEPFQEQRSKKPYTRRSTPYSRPVPETQRAAPLLSLEEKKQLEELSKVGPSHAAVIAAAQHSAQEAEIKSKLILEASQIRKEKEKIRFHEQTLAKATQKSVVQTPPKPQPGPSKITLPRPQTLLERINRDIKAQTIPKLLPIEIRSTASRPRKRFSKIIPAEKVNKRLARKFANNGLETFSEEEEEDEILKSPVSD